MELSATDVYVQHSQLSGTHIVILVLDQHCWCSWWQMLVTHFHLQTFTFCESLMLVQLVTLTSFSWHCSSPRLVVQPAPHTWEQKVDICKVFKIKIKASTTHLITRGEYLTSLLKFIPSPVWDFFVDKSPIFFTNFFLGTFNTHLKKTIGHFFDQKGLFADRSYASSKICEFVLFLSYGHSKSNFPCKF